MPKEIVMKQTRKRPRTGQLRLDLKKNLERAILAPKSKLLSLFVKENDCLVANLFSVIQKFPDAQKYLSLSTYAYKSINNRTKIFTIVGESTCKPEDLRISFQKKVRMRVYDTIAFVDNLPPLCTTEKLQRRASLFGTVADVYLPKPKKIFQKQDVLRGSMTVGHAGYGFVQFTSAYSVKRFCRRYAANSHLRRHKRSKRTKRQRLFSKSQQQNTSKEHVNETNESKEGQVVAQECSYSNSNVEWSESGLESDFDMGPKRRRTLTFSISRTEVMRAQVKEETSKTKRKIRRKRSLKSGNVSLRRLFRMIQVFPLKSYRSLKKEYYHLKSQVKMAYTVELDQQQENDSD